MAACRPVCGIHCSRMSLISLIVGGLAVANTVMMGVFERTREFGTLRAIGARPGFVRALVLSESLLLSLVDMTLVGGLLVMVMLSGYENFISKLDIDEDKEKLSWLGKMDSGSLKNKVAASIVAISSIHLLRVFMEARNVENDKLMWYVIIHLTFVLSAFVMGWLDQMSRSDKKPK